MNELRPAILLAQQLRLPSCSQLVVLRALIRLADTPFRFQLAALYQPVQRRIERPGLDFEQVVGLRTDRLADPMAVLSSPDQGSQNEHVEGALEKLEALIVGRLGHDVDSLRP